MNELKTKETFVTNSTPELQVIEARIAGHMHGMAYNLLQVGRLLIQAKEANLVPHGQWEVWVRHHTGFSERRAQSLMSAARNTPEGSRMEQLPVSKIIALLPLPEEKREAVAIEAIDGNLTVKQLEERVAQLTESRDRYQRQYQDQVVVNQQIEQARAAAEQKSEALKKRLDETVTDDDRISEKAQAQIDDLKRQLADAEDYAAAQSDLRQQAQQALLDASLGGSSSERRSHEFDADDLNEAVNAFMGCAGILVHMGPTLSLLPESERRFIRHQIDVISAWTKGAYLAIDTHVIEAE